MTKTPEPSVKNTAFACPHCGAYARQTWANLYGGRITGHTHTPVLPNPKEFEDGLASVGTENREGLLRIITWAKRLQEGEAFVEKVGSVYPNYQLHNVFVSECFNCDRPTIWVHDRIVYPSAIRRGADPHPDLPEGLRADYEEARRIVDLSPRGAAALLRLVVQKLCIELGERGRNIDDDIASLVAKGLDPVIQQALDAVRVIGNQAVHPGQMDLRDDVDTALELFELVNDIAAQTIARRKRVDAIYARLPEDKRRAINERNERAKG